MKQQLKRNLVVFEAPKDLTERAKHLADTKMISTSAICRQALMQYIKNYDMYYTADTAAKI